MTFRMMFLLLCGIPKTILFNFHYLPLKEAIKLPILVSHRVWLMEMGGKVDIHPPVRFGMIKIGFGQIGIFDQQRSRSIWQVTGKVVYKGKANLGHGTKISVDGVLILGNKFAITAESSILCAKEIIFGDNVLISWENLFMDTDAHKIKKGTQIINSNRPIIIGNNVWVGCRCTFIKGTQIGNYIVVAAN